jgi:hypothetical protein
MPRIIFRAKKRISDEGDTIYGLGGRHTGQAGYLAGLLGALCARAPVLKAIDGAARYTNSMMIDPGAIACTSCAKTWKTILQAEFAIGIPV